MNPTCPTCRRAFTAADAECCRCGTELSSLNQLLAQAEDLQAAGIRRLRQDPEVAEKLLRQSEAMLPAAETRQKLALAALLQGRFAAALHSFQKLERQQQ